MNSRLEVACATVLIVGGITSLAAQRWVFVDPTAPGDWEAAAQWIIPQVDENDRILGVPDWRDDALTHLTAVGDRVLRMRAPLAEDLYKADHIFIISEAERFDDAVTAMPLSPTVEDQQTFGSVTAARLKLKPDAFSWELYDSLGEAKVARVKGETVETCDLWNEREGRWDCKKRDRWIYVGQAHREIGDEPRQCIWAHPLDGGRTLRIETKVPAGKTLRVRDSFDLRGARRVEGAPVMMQVFVDDKLMVEDRVAGDDQDWQAHDIDISDKPSGVTMRIEVDLLGSIRDRFFCVNAWTIPK